MIYRKLIILFFFHFVKDIHSKCEAVQSFISCEDNHIVLRCCTSSRGEVNVLNTAGATIYTYNPKSNNLNNQPPHYNITIDHGSTTCVCIEVLDTFTGDDVSLTCNLNRTIHLEFNNIPITMCKPAKLYSDIQYSRFGNTGSGKAMLTSTRTYVFVLLIAPIISARF